ncbi:MAG TPA: serine hydrolase domain-containing protein [Umezawaea sp.]|nr:serine hydrolase domain-containing protein [Umezawaea sp.]
MTTSVETDLAGLAAAAGVPGAQFAVRLGGRTAVSHSGAGIGRDTAFPLGSLTKPFTAALAMLLVDDGDLHLDERQPQGWTLRHLLTHTSGLASNVDEDAEHTADRRAWVARHCGPADLVHRPGSAFSYSNIGYTVVGQMIEDATGMSWEEAVGSILLRPLGIEPVFVGGRAPARPVAVGHSFGGRRIEEQSVIPVEAPNGGLALSAADLVAFAVSCVDDLAPMFTDNLADVPIGPYGMADGWGLGWAAYQDWFGHDGSGDGTSCHLRVDPRTGDAVALTTNSATGRDLWERLLGTLDVRVPDHPTPSSPAVPGHGPTACVGRFVNGPMDFTVTRHADGGLATATGDRLEFLGELRFVLTGTSRFDGRFLRDPRSGEIDLLQVTGRLARRKDK